MKRVINNKTKKKANYFSASIGTQELQRQKISALFTVDLSEVPKQH